MTIADSEDRSRLTIGALIFDGMDQIDLTGPYEVLSSLENATYALYGLEPQPVTDIHGLRLHPDGVLEQAPYLDVLHVPGGPGQEALMDNPRVLDWLRLHSGRARCVLSVCTGALLLGAAGLLKGRQATTHWASRELLPLFGATVVDQRVVRDGNFIFAAGVTAGIDAALHVAAALRGVDEAQGVQLSIEYAPDPPFTAGTPQSAPQHVLHAVQARGQRLFEQRLATARSFAADQR